MMSLEFLLSPYLGFTSFIFSLSSGSISPSDKLSLLPLTDLGLYGPVLPHPVE